MNKDRLEVLKREIIGADINDISKGQLLLAIEAGELSDVVLEKLYESLVEQREASISPEITANTANVNDNFIELLKHMSTNNFIESCKVLHIKYGLKYGQIAEAMRIAKPTMYAIGNGTFIPSEKLMDTGITAIKEYYLGQYYSEILERI
ncbi:hypothetical protein PM004_02100 [Clostridium paraputrificum]|uniref:hypothetical protein n=1 Tax=Clostridium TaxID=1485 RepID=UPI00232F564C|nr:MULTISPECIES: hypothetical protein [Clostridium]MDB2088107.1 hypothetical protein [Clostridium paraputrificum]MDB2094858.1 hypothetical protein [Clostridium paraputrificum]MDU1178951.1 hypothetical protein [Clostridium sp.]MDU1226160.1 hypothetical protein [Clostridium sp.]MDU1309478.1 hypothetical protein [Clostridium sp.]